MKHLDKIIEMSEAEFGAIANNGRYKSREEIDSVYKLMDIVKDAMCIIDMEEDDDGMSYDDGMRHSYRYDDGASYARGRGRKRDAMGRYSRDYDGRSMRGYSRAGKEEYKQQLMEMMDSAPDEQTRMSIKRMIQQMDQQ